MRIQKAVRSNCVTYYHIGSNGTGYQDLPQLSRCIAFLRAPEAPPVSQRALVLLSLRSRLPFWFEKHGTSGSRSSRIPGVRFLNGLPTVPGLKAHSSVNSCNQISKDLVCASLVFAHPCCVVEEKNWQVRDHRPFGLRVLHAKLNRFGYKLLPRKRQSAHRCTKCRTSQRCPNQPQSTKVGRINGSSFTVLRTPHSSDLPGCHRKDLSACIPASWEAAGQAHGILESLS